MGRRNGEHGRTEWRNETRRGREWENLPVSISIVPVRWDQALPMQCDAPRGRERGQVGNAAEQRGRFRCDRMRCDAMRSVVYIGQRRRGQVPVTVASTWQGSWGRGLVRAALNGACAIGPKCWRRLEGPEAKTREGRPMIACERMDARKRGELLLPCVRCAVLCRESLKAAIELGQAGSV